MGRFVYGNGQARIEIEDRALAHLQHVVGAKLRRGEGFFFAWREDVSVGGGRRSVWVHRASDLEFRYQDARPLRLNRDWLDARAIVANSSTGLYLIPEPTPADQASSMTSS